MKTPWKKPFCITWPLCRNPRVTSGFHKQSFKCRALMFPVPVIRYCNAYHNIHMMMAYIRNLGCLMTSNSVYLAACSSVDSGLACFFFLRKLEITRWRGLLLRLSALSRACSSWNSSVGFCLLDHSHVPPPYHTMPDVPTTAEGMVVQMTLF